MEQVERLVPGQLDYLDDLRNDVDQSRERLKELEKNPWNLDKVEQAAEILRYEFNGKPTTLPPMSMLGASGQTTPDFTDFDTRIHRECKALHPEMTREERMRVVQEVYEYEFLRAYLPSLTPVEKEVLDRSTSGGRRCSHPHFHRHWSKSSPSTGAQPPRGHAFGSIFSPPTPRRASKWPGASAGCCSLPMPHARTRHDRRRRTGLAELPDRGQRRRHAVGAREPDRRDGIFLVYSGL